MAEKFLKPTVDKLIRRLIFSVIRQLLLFFGSGCHGGMRPRGEWPDIEDGMGNITALDGAVTAKNLYLCKDWRPSGYLFYRLIGSG